MISIIAAVAQNGAIGLNDRLLCHLPEDLKRLKRITYRKTLIMGRKTFESLPGVLPGRKHIVVSRDMEYDAQDDKASSDVVIERDLDVILERYANAEEEAFIFGGGSVYERALPYCQRLYLTIIKKDFDADTFFPHVEYSQFDLIERSEEIIDEKSGLVFWYEIYERSTVRNNPLH